MALFDKFIRRAKTLTELIWGRAMNRSCGSWSQGTILTVAVRDTVDSRAII